MKNILLLITVLTLSACGGKGSDGVSGSNGNPGAPGTPGNPGTPGSPGNDGARGHSIVAHARVATSLECTQTAGTAVDFYTDMDDSLGYSTGDLLQAGIVACNGSNGTNGTDGTNGTNGTNGINGQDGAPGAAGTSATMTAYNLTNMNCTSVGTNLYVQRSGNVGAALYTDSNCISSSQIDLGNNTLLTSSGNEVYATGNTVYIIEGTGDAMVLRKLSF